jgi:hypothetical protein
MDVTFLVCLIGLLRTIPFTLDGRARAILFDSGDTVVLAPERRMGGCVWLLHLFCLKNVLLRQRWAARCGGYCGHGGEGRHA